MSMGRKGIRNAKQLSRKVLDSDKNAREETNTRCFICDKVGHGWFYCPQKKTGKGCFKCGSKEHQFSKCPQRTTSAMSGGWTSAAWDDGEG